MVYPIQINSLGKLILFEKCVLPLGNFELPQIVMNLTDIITIQSYRLAFIVTTKAKIYLFNNTNYIQIDNSSETRITCLHDYCIIHDSSRCFIYDNNLMKCEYTLVETIQKHYGATIHCANEQIILHFDSTYFHFASISSIPTVIPFINIEHNGYTYLLQPNLINEIVGTSNGFFIIRSGVRLLLFDNDIVDGKTDTFSFRTSSILNEYTFSADMKLYATKNQFTIVDKDNMYVIPLIENKCLTYDELCSKIQALTCKVCTNTQILSLNDDCQLYDTGLKAVAFNDNVNQSIWSISNIQNMGEGVVIEDVLYCNSTITCVTPICCTTQQLINYLYTLSKIFNNQNPLLKQYFMKNNAANIDTEWREFVTRYPSSLGSKYSLDNFITMFYNTQLSYSRIQNVVLNSDILNIFRVSTSR